MNREKATCGATNHAGGVSSVEPSAASTSRCGPTFSACILDHDSRAAGASPFSRIPASISVSFRTSDGASRRDRRLARVVDQTPRIGGVNP